jgi:hypothetical protein
MRFKQDIIPVAAAAFIHREFRKEAWGCLEDKENWSPEAGSALEESVYQAAFELRWDHDIDAGIWDRIVRMLEPYAYDRPDWLDDDGERAQAGSPEEGESETR